MKKGLMMLLVLVMAGTIGITACQKKEEPAPPPAPETQAPPAEQPPAEGEQPPAGGEAQPPAGAK